MMLMMIHHQEKKINYKLLKNNAKWRFMLPLSLPPYS